MVKWLDYKRAVAILLTGIVILAYGCGKADISSETAGGSSTSTSNEAEAPSSRPAAAGSGELCSKHQLSTADCFSCDPSLREKGRLWCKEHDRYEDRCFICHPEIKEEGRLWCEEHKLYEDECFFCHPELRDNEKAGNKHGEESQASKEISKAPSGGLQCLEHGVLEKDCGICHPELLDNLQVGEGLKIRLESVESARKAGVQTAALIPGNSLPGFSVLGRVTYNQNDLVHVTPLSSGVVQKVLVNAGDRVKKGQLLAQITSPEIGQIKSDYLIALEDEELKKNIFSREKALLEKKISSRRKYEQAFTEYKMAQNTTAMKKQRLLNYGLTEQKIREVRETQSSSSNLQIAAPFTGTLIDRNAVVGGAVDPGEMMFILSDLSLMWLELSIPADQLAFFSVGDPVDAAFDAFPGRTFHGTLIWMSSSVDEKSRMIKARATIPNPEGLLRNGMFGEMKIVPKNRRAGFHIPATAIHRINDGNYVFVKEEPDLYEIRRVSTGGKRKDKVEVREGISPDEKVVIAHSFTLKSEFLKSRLGAGCVDE